VMGAAYLDQLGEQRNFQRSNIRLADSVATQAAVTIEHARLSEAGHARTRLLETLVSELNHRVRNNLATISGLIALQLVEDRPELTKSDVLRDSIARIQSIAVIQDLLQEEQVDLRQAAEHIAQLAQQTFVSPAQQCEIQVSGESVNLSPKAATYAGLAINELLANAIKHGLRGRSRGSVLVWVTTTQGQVTVEVADDGVGLPRGFVTNGNSHTGVRIVRGLVETELHGELSITSRPGGGTVSRIRFPLVLTDSGVA